MDIHREVCMATQYKLLILGWEPKSLSESNSSFQLLTFMMHQAFRTMCWVEVESLNLLHTPNNQKYPVFPYIVADTQLPHCDFALVISFPTKMDENQFQMIKAKTNAKQVVTLGEHDFIRLGCDFSFVFDEAHAKSKCKFISLPCPKNLMEVTTKTDSVLIDHCWVPYVGTELDWTDRIVAWCEGLPIPIHRAIKFEQEWEKIKYYERPLPPTNYIDYLSQTKTFSHFIVTHKETYGYSVIDMAARGTKILCPPGFLPDCMIKPLEASVFSTKSQMLAAIQSKGSPDVLNRCIDHQEIAAILDRYFRQFLIKSL